MANGIYINASFGNGQTLKKFGEILEKRMQYMGETSRDSVAACALDALRSIRAVTMVARPSKIKVEVQADASLVPSFSTRGNKSKFLCLRYTGTGARYAGDEKIASALGAAKTKGARVFRFTDELSENKAKYLIIAAGKAQAQQKAKKIAARRAMRFAGLARRAISLLMQKTYSKKKINDDVSLNVSVKADDVTTKREHILKGDRGRAKYSLTLEDSLRYALDAIKGGRAMVDTALRKAMNKIVSVVNRKIKGGRFLEAETLPAPFPELKQRKKNA